MRWAGAVCFILPCCQQLRSNSSWKCITRKGSSPGISSARVSTTIPLLLHCPPRFEGLIPLTTICCLSVAAGMTKPPGHIQKLYTPRPSTCVTNEYSAAGRYLPRPCLLWYCIWSMSIDGCSKRTPTAMPLASSSMLFSFK